MNVSFQCFSSSFSIINLLLFLSLLLLQNCSANTATAVGGLRILAKKESAVFRRDLVEKQLNCTEPACHGPFERIYCGGPLIWATWQFGMQKDCPGNKLRFAPEVVLKNFDSAFDGDELRRDSFERFCEDNFDNRPYLETARLPEWHEQPKLFARIRDPKMKFLAKQIHKIWPLLSKRFVEDIRRNPSRYPVVPVPNRFIVPGSLFQVYFYWDTYWIIRGLLISELLDTARGIIENFTTIIQKVGHIPNSGNVQFSRRSQPPLFTQMLLDYFHASGAHSGEDKAAAEFVRKMLPWAQKELEWWQTSRMTLVKLPLNRQSRYSQQQAKEGEEEKQYQQYNMFQYKTKTNCPRPEGFLLDFQFGIESGRNDLEFYWSSTTSAAESGMDFSSRWFSTGDEDEEMAYTRKGIETANVLPVDLNVFMALNYRAMAEMHSQLNGEKGIRIAKLYTELADSLVLAIDEVFRVPESKASPDKKAEEGGLWFDYDLGEQRLRKRFYPSNIFPLLLLKPVKANGRRNESNCLDGQRESNCARVLAYLEASGALGLKGGMPSSMERNSVELWDFPIAWPPTTHLAVLALLRCQTAEATKVARKIADGFITTAFNGLNHARRGIPAQIWEKYDARFDDGRPGFGTDNLEQIGFGWTNGVLLDFIRLFHADGTDSLALWRPI